MTRSKLLGLALAASALGLSKMPAQAQFNSGFNPFFTGPRILAPLGGGVFGNTVVTAQLANPFTANPFAGNVGNISPFTGFAPIFVGGTSGFNNVPRNIVFSGAGGSGSLNPVDFGGGNQLINDPISGFEQPRIIVNPFMGNTVAPALSTNGIDTSLFFQSNGAVNPFLVNGSINGNFGVNTLNTTATGFSPFFASNGLNGGVTFNTLNGGFAPVVPITASQLTTQAFLNNQMNQPRRVFLSKPVTTTGTITTRTAATNAMHGVTATSVTAAGHPFYYPLQTTQSQQPVTNSFSAVNYGHPFYYPLQTPQTNSVAAVNYGHPFYYPLNSGTNQSVLLRPMMGTPFRPLLGRNPVIGGGPVLFGSTSGGIPVMGGRSR